MKTPSWIHLITLTLASLLLTDPTSAEAHIESVTRITTQPVKWERTDFVVMLTAQWKNPFRSEDVRLDLELTSPSGRTIVVPAYYERGSSGASSVWHASYAPGETGSFLGRFVLTDEGNRSPSPVFSFSVANSTKKGFLHPAGPWLFRFDNGEPFRGIGENLCWEARANDDSRFFKALHENQRFNYEYMIGNLAAHGGNFTRIWMCPWNLPLEWHRVIDTTRYTDDPAPFNASAIRRMDQLVELATAADVYIMLTLDAHGSFLGQAWELNSYNARNGGPASTPEDFFVNPRAKAQYKDRLRYLVARWGFSPHLAAWEFFNEIDNAMYEQKPERISDQVITDWHAEMSEYLKSLDPSGRLITTSISHRDVAGLNRIASIDFNQKHIYKHTDVIPSAIRQYVATDHKPYVIGECGFEWDWSKDFNSFANEMDQDFKLSLWLGLFSPTPILPMSWWWEFFDERKLTPYFARVRAVHEQMLASGQGDYREIACTWSTKEVPVYGVQCGNALFVLLTNQTDAASVGQVTLPQTNSAGFTVQVYDPELDSTSAPFRLTPGVRLSPEINVGPHRNLILVATPITP